MLPRSQLRGAQAPVQSAKALDDLRMRGAGLLTQMGLAVSWTSAAPGGVFPACPMAEPARQWAGAESQILTTVPALPATSWKNIDQEPMKVQLPEDAAPLSLVLDPRLPAKKRVPSSVAPELYDSENFSTFEPASVLISESLLNATARVRLPAQVLAR